MLSQQLREMEADGIISRKVYPVVPPKTEYALTDLGKATLPIVHEMDKWGVAFFTKLGVPIPCDEEKLNLKIVVEQTPFLFLSRKERKERMFLLIIIAVLSVRQFTQLVKAKTRRQAWIIRNKLRITMYFAIFAFFAAKILESNCDV